MFPIVKLNDEGDEMCMFVMCVDLTNGEDPVGIQQISTASASKVVDLQGRISDHQQSGQTYIIDGKLRMMK